MSRASARALTTFGLCPPRPSPLVLTRIDVWPQPTIASIRTYVDFLWRDVNKRRGVRLARLYGEEFLHAA
jgi:hypothetical protein